MPALHGRHFRPKKVTVNQQSPPEMEGTVAECQGGEATVTVGLEGRIDYYSGFRWKGDVSMSRRGKGGYNWSRRK